MSSANKDLLCDPNSAQQCLGAVNSTKTKESNSLKRTESKMDEGQIEQEPIIVNTNEEEQWNYPNRMRDDSNKFIRNDSSSRGRTKPSTFHSHNQTKNNTTCIQSTFDKERKNEESMTTDDERNMSNTNDSHAMATNSNRNDVSKDFTVPKENEQSIISRFAMKFAVEDSFSMKIKCEPALESQQDASFLVKKLLEHYEKNFRKLNSRYNSSLGFDHYKLDRNGDLFCYTKSIALFIFMCDIKQYPEVINNIRIQPSLPKRLPARNALIVKFIDNKIKLSESRKLSKNNSKVSMQSKK